MQTNVIRWKIKRYCFCWVW